MKRAATTLAACAAVAAVVGCGSSSNSSGANVGTAPVVAPPQTPLHTHPAKVVVMANIAYAPTTVRVSVGQTIEWVNRDNVIHNVTSADGTTINSGDFGPGHSFEYTPRQTDPTGKPVTLKYYCTLHPTVMIAKIVVAPK
jgi:plastocyanin